MRKLVLALLSVAVAVGCGTADERKPLPLETKTVALTATENIEDNLLGLEKALTFLEGSKLLETLLTEIGFGGATCRGVGDSVDEETGEPAEYTYTEECWNEKVEIEVDFKKEVDNINKWLNEYVFVDSQVEKTDGNAVVYLLDPELFCKMAEELVDEPDLPMEFNGQSEGATDEPAWEGEYAQEEDSYEECKKLLSKVELRVKFVSYSEGDLDADILLGAQMYQVSHVQIYKDMLSIEVKLAQLHAALKTLFDAGEAEGEMLDFPKQFEGVVRLELKKLGEGQFRIACQVKEPVKVVTEAGGDDFALEIGKGEAVATATSANETLKFDVNVGSVTLKFPYQVMVDTLWEEDDFSEEFSEYGEYPDESEYPPERETPEQTQDDIPDTGRAPKVSGEVTLFVAGLTGSGTLNDIDEMLALTGLGLGGEQSYLKVKNDKIMFVEVNKHNGGKFDLTISLDDDKPVLKVKPLFDLTIGFGFKFIAKDMKEEVDDFLKDQVFHVLLDSAAEPTVRLTQEALKVVSGKLTLSSSLAPDAPIVVQEGQCLWALEDEDKLVGNGQEKPEGDGPLTNLKVGECL